MPRIPKAARAKQKDKHRKKIAKKIKQNKYEMEKWNEIIKRKRVDESSGSHEKWLDKHID